MRDKLSKLLEAGKIQTISYSGRRFYADTTFSFAYPLALVICSIGWLTWFFLSGELPPVFAYPVFLLPLLYAFIENWQRKRHDTGVCIQCGQVIPNGDTYCGESCRSSSPRTGKKEKKKQEAAGKSELERMRKNYPVQEDTMNEGI